MRWIRSTLDVDRQRYTIVGVLPPRFHGVAMDTRPVDVWMPLATLPSPPVDRGLVARRAALQPARRHPPRERRRARRVRAARDARRPPRGRPGARAPSSCARAGERSAEAATAALRQALRQALPDGIVNVTPVTENLEPQYRPWRMGARLFTGFGLLALAIAMVGMYGTVSYGVSQRTHEFGVRAALGARVRDIVTLVLRQAPATVSRGVALGVALGVGLALAAGRLVAALVFGISPRDPAVMGGVALVLVAMAAVAALLPAWRGAKVDPATVLRTE